jgi:sigma-B regulation protein RsbU (phosphoserine phosphatase)
VGFPLGLYDDLTYEEWSLNLEPGNILVFQSDGLSEAPDPEGRQFGTERLASLLAESAALSSGEIADRMLGEVNEFTHGAPVQDDRTLVVMKVR